MMIRKRIFRIILFHILILTGIISCASAPNKSSDRALRISKETLNTWLDDSSLIIIDVRLPKDWKKSGEKIKGAVQEDPNKFADWLARYPKTKTIVLY